ncbi:MAG: site-2 protease family protein [Lachnospiraceae bacterium]|nr:site-2 protease family protein [Lachnospiraceae bacterium]
MNHQKSDPIIDCSYLIAFVISFCLFLYSFFGCAGALSAHFGREHKLGEVCTAENTAIPGQSTEAILIEEAAEVIVAAVISVLLFIPLILSVIVVHELGHLIGGFLAGYKAAHFCVFGGVFSFVKRLKVHYDRSAVLGGYVVMRSNDHERSPLLLIRMGPLSECIMLIGAAVLFAFWKQDAAGIFLQGEISGFLLVRIAASGKSSEDDSSTAAQVSEEGPRDYNRLMDIYDEMLMAKALSREPKDEMLMAKALSREPKDESAFDGDCDGYRRNSAPDRDKMSSGKFPGRHLTIKEELTLYGKEK